MAGFAVYMIDKYLKKLQDAGYTIAVHRQHETNVSERNLDCIYSPGTFFSQENIQIIQNGIRAGVYHKSNGQYLIGQQDCDTLKIIMRSIFLQYSANLPTNIAGQIKELNKMVLEFSIPSVFGEAKGYIKYLYDASTLAVPLATPICDTQYDKRTHKMPNWF